eukprot:CAMPEP_0194356338 /NCGR_PEP_ID=MMETSP0174-20130528/4023_1 /TAXON_ID=216777 /ORGANISM="Proboscia alata, Strain PI-D3" /LENGTH=408 /DNA_ID=CAMNT_0039125897 /DNA_START=226 /DNA_END=1449 /DNA_ORIENTATION=+
MHRVKHIEMGSCCEALDDEKKNCSLDCALGADDCNEAERFFPHDDTKKCNSNNVQIGRCIQENACAVRYSECAQNKTLSNFNAFNESCTFQRDKSIEWSVNDPEYTQFGSCRNTITNEYFCIYDPADCEESGMELYVTPEETMLAGFLCDCSQVHVFACLLMTSTSYCALNANGCLPDHQILSPNILRTLRNETKDDWLDCRLCSKVNTAPPTMFPIEASIRPTSHDPTMSPIGPRPIFPESGGLTTPTPSGQIYDENNMYTTPTLIALFILSFLVILPVTYFCIKIVRQKGAPVDSEFQLVPPPPVRSIMVGDKVFRASNISLDASFDSMASIKSGEHYDVSMTCGIAVSPVIPKPLLSFDETELDLEKHEQMISALAFEEKSDIGGSEGSIKRSNKLDEPPQEKNL